MAVMAIAVMAYGVSVPPGTAQKAPDVIYIDGLKTFGGLERMPVPFQHDKHTLALKKQGKDCAFCHPKAEDGKRSLKYKRLADTGRDEVMDLYHSGCISCHNEVLSSGEKSGPLVCGECHIGDTKVVSSRVPPKFDKSLHARHTQAMENNCELCHHSYDEKAQKKIYVKGKEESCRYCHGDKQVENKMPFSSAAHTNCILCHQQKLNDKKDSGPVECAGCHAAENLKRIKVLKEVPRMQRGQPEVTFISAGKQPDGDKPQMKLVPFDHKTHESANDSCIVCHHESLQSCAECHTTKGTKEGGFVNLERAMHSLGNDQSCLGCHSGKQKQDPSCAGCHIRQSGAFENKETCQKCHQAGAPPKGASKEAIAGMAADALQERIMVTATYPQEDIPETVSIGVLADKYHPAEFPHRRIVNKLMEGLGDSKMAQAFHAGPGTMCQGCHHNSPPTKKPPQCASCHNKPFNPQKMSMPGLKAAYHQQCMNCHQAMKLESPKATQCAECHKAKD